jgi:hypothetical protein
LCTAAETKDGTTISVTRCSSERGISREGNLIFHSISKENEERKLAPMSVNGVKFITSVASYLAIFDKRPAKPTETTEVEGQEEPEQAARASERPALRLYHDQCIAMIGAR